MKEARPSPFMFKWLNFDQSWSVHGIGTNHWTGGTFFYAKLPDKSANSEQVCKKLRSIICRILWKYKNLLILSNWCTFSPSVEGLRDHECSWFFIQTWFHFNRGDKKPWPALMKKARPSPFMFMWLTFDKSWSVHGNHTTYSWNNKWRKCAGMGLNGFIFKK